jgi:hypothetical protein
MNHPDLEPCAANRDRPENPSFVVRSGFALSRWEVGYDEIPEMPNITVRQEANVINAMVLVPAGTF